MTTRTRLVFSAMTACAVLAFAGCTASTPTPGSTESKPVASIDPSLVPESDFDRLLPRNSTSQSVVLRSEGKLSAGSPVDATSGDLSEAGWVAQFACELDDAADAEVTGTVLINGEVVVEATPIDCSSATPTSMSFSGAGKITVRISSDVNGIYVSQISKNPAV